MRGRAGRTTGLKGVILFLPGSSESNWPAAGGTVQGLILAPSLVHLRACDRDNGMCCASLRFASDTKLEGSNQYPEREIGLVISRL